MGHLQLSRAEAADLARRLAAAERDLLGFGDAGLVLGAGPRWALKLVYDGADGWPAWARWARANPGPHVPRVAELVEVAVEGRRLAVLAVVERLRPTAAARRWLAADRALKRDPLALAARLEPEQPALAAMLRRAAAAFPGAAWDMTPSNWMERQDGMPVLTDPFMQA